MKKILLVSMVLFLLSTVELKAQQQKGLFLKAGLTRFFYQDVEYAAQRYYHLGLNFDVGYRNQKEQRIYEYGLTAKLGTSVSGYDQTTIHPVIYFTYLRKVAELYGGNLFVGGRTDVWDILLFLSPSLMNNELSYFSSNGYYVSGEWRKQLNEKWHCDGSLSILLLGFVKEIPTYGYLIPKQMLSKGEFTPANEKVIYPYNLKYYEFKTLGNYNRYKVSIGFTKNKKIRFSYDWDFTYFPQTRHNPLIFGNQNISTTLFFGKK